MYIACDTETYKGKAFLLSTPRGVFPIHNWETVIDAFQWARADPLPVKYPRFVFYNIDYDATALLRHFPDAIVKALYLDVPVEFYGMTLRYIPGKFLQLGSFECYDLYSFFQTSLNACAFRFFGEQKIGLPPGLVADLSPENYRKHKELIDEYAIRDAHLLQKLTDKLTDALPVVGLSPDTKLYSPGYIAKKALKRNGVTISPLPKSMRGIAESVYYGGRIEVLRRGHFKNVYCYDIKSAYPHAVTQLPDFSRAQFVDTPEPETEYYVCKIRFTSPADFIAYPIAEKVNDLVIYPRHINRVKWVTSIEHKDLLRIGANVEMIDCVSIIAPGGKSPLGAFIEEIYPKRKDSEFEGVVYKLILNSTYGILAETRKRFTPLPLDRAHRRLEDETEKLGSALLLESLAEKCPHAEAFYLRECNCKYCKAARRLCRTARQETVRVLEYQKEFYERSETPGFFSNRIYAAFITAYVRSRLWLALGEPYAIAGFTDSIFLDREWDAAKENPKLGDWAFERFGDLTIVGSGIYQHGKKTKWRGYRTRENLIDILAEMPHDSRDLSGIDRISIARAVQRGYRDYSSVNILQAAKKTFSLNFDKKRVWPRPFENGSDVLTNKISSMPISIICSGDDRRAIKAETITGATLKSRFQKRRFFRGK